MSILNMALRSIILMAAHMVFFGEACSGRGSRGARSSAEDRFEEKSCSPVSWVEALYPQNLSQILSEYNPDEDPAGFLTQLRATNLKTQPRNRTV